MRPLKRTILFSFLLLLSACGGEFSGPGETLRILGAPLEPAFVDEAYSSTLRVVGGLTPYTFEVSRGTLPPGLTLQGATLRGVPTEEGEYSFTVTVTDANLSKTFGDYVLRVTTPPPASLTLNPPSTDVQRTVTLRGVVTDARELEGLRSVVTWDADLFQLVPDSVGVTSERYGLFYEAAPGRLQLDLAVLGGTLDGERTVFTFDLQPLVATTLAVAAETEFVGRRGHAFERKEEGVPSGQSRPDGAAPPDPNLDAPEGPADEGDLD